MSGGAKAPDPISPGEAAQAAVGTAGAGEMMSIANQPVEQYSNLATTEQLGPAETQTQQSLANQAAYQSASGQQAIQSAIDPQAYAQRQMRLSAATSRLGQLYGVNPTTYAYRDPSAFAIPGSNAVPNVSTLAGNAAGIASNLSTGSVDSSGGNPQLLTPQGNAMRTTIPAQSYLA